MPFVWHCFGLTKNKIMAKNLNTDLTDSERDKERLKPEETIIDLPDVADIPGQENVHVPDMHEMADTTISSDDEEGTNIFNEPNSKDLTNDRFGAAQQLNEDDLIIGDDEELEADIEEDEDDEELTDDDISVTDDSVDEDSDVSDDEKIALERTADNMDTRDNENLYRSQLDNTDFDGEKLNDDVDDVSGKDLDVPGQEEDDLNEEIGEEDEENNEYSLGDNK